MNKIYAIIEIGSNNTKTHIYKNEEVIYENTTTIEFKKNYKNENKINENDLISLEEIINNALKYTKNVNIYGCSIFRNISKEELDEINKRLNDKFNLEIQVVSQDDEAQYTALGCYSNIEYDGNICIFIGGGGSTELIFVNNKKIIDKKYYDFGVVDITNKFESLRNDIPECTFDDVYNYVNELIKDINIKADVLILAGGDHLYWYNNARYKLIENSLYKNENQKYMLTIEMSDNYDRDALVTSLDRIRQNSDNPKWFDGSYNMKRAYCEMSKLLVIISSTSSIRSCGTGSSWISTRKMWRLIRLEESSARILSSLVIHTFRALQMSLSSSRL